MTINDYSKILEETLQNHKHPPYERSNEGFVYVGRPELIKFESNNQKNQFVNLLCLFIAFDLKIFESYNNYYEIIKTNLRIPKFEYGLTNIFIQPERIFEHYKTKFDMKVFEGIYSVFENYILQMIDEQKINIDLVDLSQQIINDPDINNGIWGKNYCDFLVRTYNLNSIISKNKFKPE